MSTTPHTESPPEVLVSVMKHILFIQCPHRASRDVLEALMHFYACQAMMNGSQFLTHLACLTFVNLNRQFWRRMTYGKLLPSSRENCHGVGLDVQDLGERLRGGCRCARGQGLAFQWVRESLGRMKSVT